MAFTDASGLACPSRTSTVRICDVAEVAHDVGAESLTARRCRPTIVREIDRPIVVRIGDQCDAKAIQTDTERLGRWRHHLLTRGLASPRHNPTRKHHRHHDDDEAATRDRAGSPTPAMSSTSRNTGPAPTRRTGPRPRRAIRHLPAAAESRCRRRWPSIIKAACHECPQPSSVPVTKRPSARPARDAKQRPPRHTEQQQHDGEDAAMRRRFGVRRGGSIDSTHLPGCLVIAPRSLPCGVEGRITTVPIGG